MYNVLCKLIIPIDLLIHYLCKKILNTRMSLLYELNRLYYLDAATCGYRCNYYY